MDLGMIEDNKYEIIATFRNEFRRKSEIEIDIAGVNIITRILQINACSFTIFLEHDICAGEAFRFILHSDSGKLEFISKIVPDCVPDETSGYTFSLPKKIRIVQRRSDQRLDLRNDQGFSCSGRYKNGKNYAFQIVDVSTGGCALLSHSPSLEFQKGEFVLKQSNLHFKEYGDLVTDLTVKNVSIVNTISGKNTITACYKLSCQFNFKSLLDKNKVDKLVTGLILERKRKRN